MEYVPPQSAFTELANKRKGRGWQEDDIGWGKKVLNWRLHGSGRWNNLRIRLLWESSGGSYFRLLRLLQRISVQEMEHFSCYGLLPHLHSLYNIGCQSAVLPTSVLFRKHKLILWSSLDRRNGKILLGEKRPVNLAMRKMMEHTRKHQKWSMIYLEASTG